MAVAGKLAAAFYFVGLSCLAPLLCNFPLFLFAYCPYFPCFSYFPTFLLSHEVRDVEVIVANELDQFGVRQ